MDALSGRIAKELKEIESDKASGVTALVVNDNLQKLLGSVPGPQDTPYEGGLFKVDIQLDSQYPFAPPKMKFITRVWHPNVSSQTGAICLGRYFGNCQQKFLGLSICIAQAATAQYPAVGIMRSRLCALLQGCFATCKCLGTKHAVCAVLLVRYAAAALV